MKRFGAKGAALAVLSLLASMGPASADDQIRFGFTVLYPGSRAPTITFMGATKTVEGSGQLTLFKVAPNPDDLYTGQIKGKGLLTCSFHFKILNRMPAVSAKNCSILGKIGPNGPGALIQMRKQTVMP